MMKWYLELRKIMREIAKKAIDARDLLKSGDKDAAKPINNYIKTDYARLQDLWKTKMEGDVPTYLGRHVAWGMENDYSDILQRDLPELEEILDGMLLEEVNETGDLGFEGMLHPIVAKSSYQQYRDGHLRDSVANSIIAVFDLIRKRTGIDADGSDLVDRVFSLNEPRLVLSEIATESGKNDQKGFMQIFRGAYQGIRNPKAHSLRSDLTAEDAAQYLVFASLLARRVEKAVKKRSKAFSGS